MHILELCLILTCMETSSLRVDLETGHKFVLIFFSSHKMFIYTENQCYETCGVVDYMWNVFYRRGNMVVDHFLMVYDLRMIRAMAPIQTAIDPIFLKIVPTYSDRICVVSQVFRPSYKMLQWKINLNFNYTKMAYQIKI